MLEIIENRNNNIFKFSNLQIGDIFKIADSEYMDEMDDNGIYMKSERKTPNSIRLNNGMMLTIHSDTYCERVNGMLEIKKYNGLIN